MRKLAATLAKEYDWESEQDYFNYIVESLINGQRQQCKDLFNKMKRSDQDNFLINYLDESVGIEKSCKNILISEI